MRYRRPQGGRGQQRFSQFEDKFIYGHDDEPDYNDDHTSFHFDEEFLPEYENKTPYKHEIKIQDKPEEELTKKFIDESTDGNLFGKFEEENESKTEEENKEEDPSLREFTLIISKLLFHLSQME